MQFVRKITTMTRLTESVSKTSQITTQTASYITVIKPVLSVSMGSSLMYLTGNARVMRGSSRRKVIVRISITN